jgi:hypothetical protein
MDVPGIVPISLTCRLPGIVDGYVTYVRPPRVVSVVPEAGLCQALAACVFLITVSDPPQTVIRPDHIRLAMIGGSFLPRDGTSDDVSIEVNVVALNGEVMILRVSTPVLGTDGVLNGAFFGFIYALNRASLHVYVRVAWRRVCKSMHVVGICALLNATQHEFV